MSRIGSVTRRLPLAIESAVALTLSSIFVATRSQSKTTQLLGQARAVDKGPSSPPAAAVAAASSPQAAPVVAERAVRLGRTVERVASLLPWHPVCLPTAVATVWMLRRRRIPCEAHLGITTTTPPGAHAWVTVDGRVVQGGDTTEVTELAVFV